MRYRTRGERAHNDAIDQQHLTHMVNHANMMRDQLIALRGRLAHLTTARIIPDGAGECDGHIAETADFERVHKMMTETAAHVASLYNQTVRRIDRETARTSLQILDGTI